MSQWEALLGTLAMFSFIMTTAGFVALVWRVSWGVRGFAEAEQERAKAENDIALTLRDFVRAQRETNDQVWTAIQVQATRVNKLVERSRE